MKDEGRLGLGGEIRWGVVGWGQALDSGERETLDMGYQFRESWRFGPQHGAEAVDQRAVLQVKEALADDAEAEQVQGTFVEAAAGHFAQGFEELVTFGPDVFVDHAVEGRGGRDHFPRHDQTVPGRAFRIQSAPDHAFDEKHEPFHGGRVLGPGAGVRRFLGGTVARGDQFLVETGLVPKVIVDGGDVYAGPLGDHSNGCPLVSQLREHAAGGLDDPLADGEEFLGRRWISGKHGGYHVNSRLKRNHRVGVADGSWAEAGAGRG